MSHNPEVPPEHSVRAHSLFSPSGSGRWMVCTASVRMEQESKLPPPGPSPYADEGTKAHELAERCLVEGRYATDLTGHSEMAEAVDVYTQYIFDLVDAHPQHHLWIELTVDLGHIIPDQFGHVDAAFFDPVTGVLHIIDYKHGQGVPVEARGNTQLGLYALGAIEYLKNAAKLIESPRKELKEIHLTIVQPRAIHPNGPIRTHLVDIDELIALRNRAQSAYEEATGPNPKFKPGESQCRWCKAAGVCKALADYAADLAFEEFKGLFESPVKVKELEQLHPAELAWLLSHVDLLKGWLNAIEATAQGLLEAGEDVPGYKLVRARSNRSWGLDSDVVVSELIALGLDEDDLFTEPKLVSPAQAEKLLPAKRRGELSHLIVKPEGRLTIAVESDPRPAVGKGPDCDFKEFATGE